MKKKDQIYHCLNCNTLIPFKGYTQTHKYCNSKCCGEHRSYLKMEKWRPLWNEGKDIGRPRQKLFLTEERGYNCEVCNLSNWLDAPITLQVDHIDGDADNNFKNNLRLICPNCHSQTPTFAGGNKGKGRWSKGLKDHYKGQRFSHGKPFIELTKGH